MLSCRPLIRGRKLVPGTYSIVRYAGSAYGSKPIARTMLGWTSPWMAAPSRWRLRTYCPSVGILIATSWSVQTWWWAFQPSPKEPPPIFSTRTYSLIRWLGVGIRSLRSGQLLCDPIARQEIIHTGHQGP